MQMLRAYLLRLTACSFLVSICAALVSQPKLKRLVKLMGGCLLALTALQPLLSIDFTALPDLLYPYGLSQQNAVDEAERKNAQLLEDLIRKQTEASIQDALDEQGIDARFHLTLRMDQSVGMPVPWSVTVYADCDEEKQNLISDFFSSELGIAKERQVWSDP